MSASALKIALTLLVAGGGIGWLVIESAADNLEYYKKVEEVMVDQARWTGPKLKLGGNVKTGSIFNKPGTVDYVFTVEHGGESVEVRYSGPMPDTFREGSEVVVAGRLAPAGHFEANEVIAKCPSKYEGEGKGGYDAALVDAPGS